jgi:hypothetical protein
MLGCISTNLDGHFIFSAAPLLSKDALDPVKNVISRFVLDLFFKIAID